MPDCFNRCCTMCRAADSTCPELSRADRQMVTQRPRVIEPIAIVFEVLQQPLRTGFHVAEGVPSCQPLQGGKEIRLLPSTQLL